MTREELLRKAKDRLPGAERTHSLRIHLSMLLGTAVLDASGRSLGRLRDVAIASGDHPLVSELIWGRKNEMHAAAPEEVTHTTEGHLRLRNDVMPRSLLNTEALLLLDRDLLDQQIIDIHGRKVVRVNDVTLLWSRNGDSGELRPVEVEIGTRSAMRRLLKGLAPKDTVEYVVSRVRSNAIPWEFVNLIEADPSRRVHLKISHTRLAQFHPSDLADILEDLAPAERESIFRTLDEEVAAEALEEVAPKLQKRLVEAMGSERAADIMEEMDPSAAADLLGELPKDQSEAILEEMAPEDRQEVSDLLEFSEHSAAGRMTTNYIAVPPGTLISQAVEELRHFEDDPETVTAIYLVDEQGALCGVVPLPRLLLAPPDSPITLLLDGSHTISCPVTMHDKQVAELFDRYNLLSLPVIDEQNVLVGVIHADHVISFMRQQI